MVSQIVLLLVLAALLIGAALATFYIWGHRAGLLHAFDRFEEHFDLGFFNSALSSIEGDAAPMSSAPADQASAATTPGNVQ